MATFDERGPSPTAPTAPTAPPGPPVLPYLPVPQQVDARMVRQFRQQIHALGGLWIIFGCLALGLGVYALSGDGGAGLAAGDGRTFLSIVLVLGALWLAVGVLACMKQMWAVYAGLALSYLSAVGNLFQVNLCGLVITVLVILQAHRVISWAGKMRAAGVPLTAKP